MALQSASLSGVTWTPYASSSNDFIAAVSVDLNAYASVSVTPRGSVQGTTAQLREASGVVVDNMQGTSDCMVQIGPVLEFVPRYQKTVIPLFPGSPDVVFYGAGIVPRVYFYVGTFRGVGTNLNAFASNQAANVASITGGTVDAYLQTIRWRYTYQLAAGFNLDNIVDSGFYDVLNPVNSGTSLPAGTWMIENHVYSQSPLFAVQRARDLISTETRFYERRNVVGVWTPWRNIGQPVTGQCRFEYVNAGQCRLIPFGGGLLTVAGNMETVPSAGVTIGTNIGAAPLANSTLYYAYAYMSAPGVMALEWSVTAFALDGRGCPIKAGDPSRTCVGMAYTSPAGVFADAGTTRYVASYFNRRRIAVLYDNGAVTTGSTTPVALGVITFLSWGQDATRVAAYGYAQIGAPNGIAQLSVKLDGTRSTPDVLGQAYTSNARVPLKTEILKTCALGVTTFTAEAYVGSAVTTTASFFIGTVMDNLQ